MKTIGLLIAVAICSFSTASAASRGSDHSVEVNGMIDIAARPAYEVEGGKRQVVHRPWRRAAPKVSRGRPRAKAESVVSAPPVPAAYSIPPAFEAAQASALGALLGVPAGWEDGLSSPKPIIVAGPRPAVLTGTLMVAGQRYAFVSGGAGLSIPYNDYEISPNSQGSWGSRHGALDLTGSARSIIPDRQAGRNRLGIELHEGHGRTEGCMGIDRWREAKAQIVGMIKKFGRAFLHVWPGTVFVSPDRSPGRQVVVLAVLAKPHAAEPARKRYAHHYYRRRHYASAT